MEDDQQFCLRWNNHQSTLISVFDTLLENETLVDCTLAAEGKFLKAHKVVLSACSPYFATLLQEQYDKHPIFILKDVKYQELRAMMDYMYRGEVNISQDQLAALLKAAESLQIKGLSDNRTGGGSMPKHEQPQQHRGLGLPGAGLGGGKHVAGGGYTLEQTKRARMGPASIDSQELSGSREGSSSPTSRRRRKVRRRSIENAMADAHDNSNSSQIQPIATTSSLLQQQSNASLGGVSAITAAASALASQVPASAAAALPTAAAASTIATAATLTGTTQQQQMTAAATSVTKKTESAKGSSIIAAATGDVMHSELLANIDEQQQHAAGLELKSDKQNHKQQKSVLAKEAAAAAASSVAGAELVIEPKSEYDDEGNDENVEDLTLDDEDMGMEDLDHNAGTSHGNEGSSQGYAQWQHDRSQDEVFMATQEAQQRDPQDLSKKFAQVHKENASTQFKRTQPRSILNTQQRPRSRNSLNADGSPQQQQQAAGLINGNRKRLSANDVSDMLFELYKANAAKAPKNQQQAPGQTSPTSAEAEPSTIAAIATKSAAADNNLNDTASKNLQGDEMMSNTYEEGAEVNAAHASFHPRIKFSSVCKSMTSNNVTEKPQTSTAVITAIPTSVLVSTAQEIDIKPLIHPTTGLIIERTSAVAASVIQPAPAASSNVPQAAAIAAALLRDGYHNFQQQLRAQELLKIKQPQTLHNPTVGTPTATGSGAHCTPTKLFENFLRQQRAGQQQRHSECDNERHSSSDTNDGDDEEEDSRYNGFDDIHLIEGSKTATFNNNGGALTMFPSSAPAPSDYISDESQKFMIAAQAQAQAFRNLEYSMSDYGGNSPGDGEPTYECRHCGKKYRWKSTLRRHENVECGGKEPSHQCPYCPYKSKQRGNLGVHVRKHHSNLPQLASKRRSKYSVKLEEGGMMGEPSSANASDDSSSKLMIDFSK